MAFSCSGCPRSSRRLRFWAGRNSCWNNRSELSHLLLHPTSTALSYYLLPALQRLPTLQLSNSAFASFLNSFISNLKQPPVSTPSPSNWLPNYPPQPLAIPPYFRLRPHFQPWRARLPGPQAGKVPKKKNPTHQAMKFVIASSRCCGSAATKPPR